MEGAAAILSTAFLPKAFAASSSLRDPAEKGLAFMFKAIELFHLSVPQADLDDLRARLTRTRWPDKETVGDTSQGPQLAKIQALIAHWANDYDWRACETLLNGWGQHKTEIDGVGIHFLHVRSPEPDALPLLLLHGWPGSILEFRKLIGPLTNPSAHGATGTKAFHVVIPSMPGYGFSDRPTTTGWDLPRIARAYVELMSRLGYDRWGIQGGDLGAAVTDEIALLAPAGLVGMHSNFAMFMPTSDEMKAATPDEQAMLKAAGNFWENLSGYAKIQGTRPQTIGYALADSPVAQASWIYAMFQDTCGTPGDAEATFTLDEMLDDIMIYWLTNSGASSARLYWEMTQTKWSSAARIERPIAVPAGFSMLKCEAVRKSRRWIERRYTDLRFFADHAEGGHFAALEQPKSMIDDIRATFAGLR
jgi:microsomal epoxide hydrolase